MKPYLTPNPTLAFFVEWGILIVSILLIFSPFIYLGFKKWKKHLPITWSWIFVSYFYSFVIYLVWDWVILDWVDRFIYNNYINTGWLQDTFFNPSFKMIFIVILGWPTLVFYCTKLIKSKFTKLNLIISFFVSILFFIGLVVLWFYVMAIGLGYVGRTYF